MTLSQYKQLNTEWQQAFLDEKGVFLAKRTQGDNAYRLYQVGSFYVELGFYAPLQALTGITAFSGTEGVEPYLQHIDLDELFCA